MATDEATVAHARNVEEQNVAPKNAPQPNSPEAATPPAEAPKEEKPKAKQRSDKDVALYGDSDAVRAEADKKNEAARQKEREDILKADAKAAKEADNAE